MADGGFGQQTPANPTSDQTFLDFHVFQKLARVRTNIPVKVLSVKNGGLSSYATVSVQPLIKQVDGLGNVVSHGEIYNIPVMRWSGGDSSLILDPSVGDIGFIGVSDRDIGALKANGYAESQPGSNRRHDLADGIYLGKVSGSQPNQYVIMDANGVKIVDRNGNIMEMNSAGIVFTTPTAKFSGDVHAVGAVIAGFGGGDQVGLQTHTHHPTDPTSPPIPGT